MVIQHDDGAIGNVLLAQAREVLPQGAFREVIEVKVERSVEYLSARWAARGHACFRLVRVFERLIHGEHKVYEMRRLKTALCCRQAQRLAHRALELIFAQRTRESHLAQDPPLPVDRAREVRLRVQPARGLRQPGQQGAFSGTEIAQRLGEVELPRASAAAVEIAIVQAIQVGGQNPLLIPHLFEP